MPSFSSTRSFMRWTCRIDSHQPSGQCVKAFHVHALLHRLLAYLVVGLDVQLDLFAGEGADSVGG
jgi:hypothetical protein